jgi:protoporphyrinogen/coproporphyrinogen III oxidase
MRIAIIGGGIAGLAAAYELEQANRTGTQIEYTLFEANNRLGGCLASETVGGTVLERGPDSFITEKTSAAELCRELGLDSALIPSNDADRKTCIVIRNRLIPLPDGLMFLVPTKLIPTLLTPLFSLRTKLRMGLELLLPPPPTELPDESVATLIERHFGRETVDRLADPLLSGIYGGDATKLSALTVLPRMIQMEHQYGSLTRGMLAAHHRILSRAKAPMAEEKSQPIFTALRGGMQQLVDAVTAQLDPACVRLSTPVTALGKTSDGWRIEIGDTARFYDAVIVATPAWAAGALLGKVDPALGEELRAIPYSSSITVNLVYDETKMGRLPDGFGFLVPASENRAMLAATYVHRKFSNRSAPGKAVLRAFLGGMRNETLLDKPDDALITIVRRELGEILGEDVLSQAVKPEHAQVSRWRRVMAQYAVGHQELRQRIARHVTVLPSLRLAGNAYDGIGVPDCIRLGRQAARELIANCF